MAPEPASLVPSPRRDVDLAHNALPREGVMSMKNRRTPAVMTAVVLAAVVLVAVAACSTVSGNPGAANGNPSGSPAPAATFTVAELEPASLVPGKDDGLAADELNALFAPLTKFDAQNHLTDVQASSVLPNATATVWTITIRPG